MSAGVEGCIDCATAHPPPCQAHAVVSVVDDRLDQMVQQASIPNLATLFKRAKDAGVITTGKEYGGA